MLYVNSEALLKASEAGPLLKEVSEKNASLVTFFRFGKCILILENLPDLNT